MGPSLDVSRNAAELGRAEDRVMGIRSIPGRGPVSTSREAVAAAAAVSKLAHRVHAMTGGDLVDWLATADGETWAVQTCMQMDALLRAVRSAKAKAEAKAAAKAAAPPAGEAEPAE